MAQQKQIPRVSMRMQVHPWPCSVGQRSSIAMGYGVGHACGSDLVLLWLWQCDSDPTPGLETSIHCRHGPKEPKNKQTKTQSFEICESLSFYK